MRGAGCLGSVRRAAAVGTALLLACALVLAIGAPRAPAAPGCSGRHLSLEAATGSVGGVTVLSDYEDPVCITGSVHVTYASAGPQCTGGPCGYSGTYTWRPCGLSTLEVETERSRGVRSRNVSLGLGGDASALEPVVRRAGPNGGQFTCTDRSDGRNGSYSLSVRHGQAAVDLAVPDQPVYGSRCAGPPDGDLAKAMPSARISLRAIARGGQVIDLRHSGTFAAGGFTGAVTSTLRLRLGRPITATRIPNRPSGKRHRVRLVGAVYAIDGLTGRATATVTTPPNLAVCGPLDACGLSGTLTFAPGAHVAGEAIIGASAPLKRPKRDLLAALGLSAHGDPKGISVSGFTIANPDLALTSTISQMTTCTDRTSIDEALAFLAMSHGRLLFPLDPASDEATDPLRTRCPGPDLGDNTFVAGSVSRGVLRRRLITLPLRGRSFHDRPYGVAIDSTLVLRMTRKRVITQVMQAVDVNGAESTVRDALAQQARPSAAPS